VGKPDMVDHQNILW